MTDDLVVKILGAVDISAALLLALLHIPLIGPLKWLLVAILLIKGIPSLLA